MMINCRCSISRKSGNYYATQFLHADVCKQWSTSWFIGVLGRITYRDNSKR